MRHVAWQQLTVTAVSCDSHTFVGPANFPWLYSHDILTNPKSISQIHRATVSCGQCAPSLVRARKKVKCSHCHGQGKTQQHQQEQLQQEHFHLSRRCLIEKCNNCAEVYCPLRPEVPQAQAQAQQTQPEAQPQTPSYAIVIGVDSQLAIDTDIICSYCCCYCCCGVAAAAVVLCVANFCVKFFLLSSLYYYCLFAANYSHFAIFTFVCVNFYCHFSPLLLLLLPLLSLHVFQNLFSPWLFNCPSVCKKFPKCQSYFGFLCADFNLDNTIEKSSRANGKQKLKLNIEIEIEVGIELQSSVGLW